ncbi:hypothetical protein C900_04827 [Fulvivirga imtechensis AK7]|uniref:Lipoprotein n=1 Tax=Fulvivirga imtechensis AK7 TaxID=1237149 RepID=L8JQF0_9BACT|nr:DUF6624 domain-containing protein [Fulvivirga imtechensis]ELR69602.1 hypothetical protein C900_04827 [Fulvivirga imtechensis AK7]
MKNLTYLSLALLFFACNSGELRKLSPEEAIALAKDGDLNYLYAEFKNKDGQPLNDEERDLLNSGKMTRHFYVDSNDEIKEVRVVEPALEDKFFEIMLREVAVNPLRNMTLVNIDCSDLMSVLADIYEKDQAVRTGGEGDMNAIDSLNQQQTVSIIEQCGFPTKDEVGGEGMTTVFLVLQHSSSSLMAYYYPQIKRAVERGDIRKSSFALMQDRLLMWNGFKQIYGSQISNGSLYALEDPETVNERRATMGLDPIEDYLEHFDLNFEEEVAKMEEVSN